MKKLNLYEEELPNYNENNTLKDAMKQFHDCVKKKIEITERLVNKDKQEIAEREEIKKELIACVRDCEASKAEFNRLLEQEGLYDIEA